jgi:hypothetical protein
VAAVGPVPFSIGEGFDNESSVHGRVSFGGASLTLELMRNHQPAELSSRKVVIGIEEFASVDFHRGLLGDRLHLRTAALGALGGVPGASLEAVTLKFSRKDRGDAEALAARLAHVVVDRAPLRGGLDCEVEV